MNTLNIVARTTSYREATTNNSTTVAIAGLNEARRLEKEYPSREFLSDTQRAKAVFNVMMQRANAGAYQVFSHAGPIRRISMFSLCATPKQAEVSMHCVLGRVVTTHTLPNGFSLTKVGYMHLIASLEAIADLDCEVTRDEPKGIPTAGKITAEDVANNRSNTAA